MVARKIPVNAGGNGVGEHHHRARYPDVLVATVRDLHEQQHVPYEAIAQRRLYVGDVAYSVPYSTVRSWCQCTRRTAVPVAVRRVEDDAP